MKQHGCRERRELQERGNTHLLRRGEREGGEGERVNTEEESSRREETPTS